MYDFMAQHQLYIVLGIVLLVWAGIVAYLVRLDGKVKRLEQRLKKD